MLTCYQNARWSKKKLRRSWFVRRDQEKNVNSHFLASFFSMYYITKLTSWSERNTSTNHHHFHHYHHLSSVFFPLSHDFFHLKFQLLLCVWTSSIESQKKISSFFFIHFPKKVKKNFTIYSKFLIILVMHFTIIQEFLNVDSAFFHLKLFFPFFSLNAKNGRFKTFFFEIPFLYFKTYQNHEISLVSVAVVA